MPGKILLVEDDRFLIKACYTKFTQHGYEVILANDGDEGISKAKSDKPDIVLLDMVLPKKNGFEVLEELKKDSATKNIPVAVLTNLEGSAEVERALALGATTYLVKANYKPDELLAKIEVILNHHS